MEKSTFILEFENYMVFKGYRPRTITAYIAAVIRFVNNFGMSPRNITVEQIRGYLLGMRSPSKQRHITSALRLLYIKVVKQPQKALKIEYARREQKLPDILDKDFIIESIGKIKNIKHRALLTMLYSVGLRRDELRSILIGHISGKRKQLKVVCGKGGKDRYLPISD